MLTNFSSSSNPSVTTASGLYGVFGDYKTYDPYTIEAQYNNFLGYPSDSERTGAVFLTPDPPQSVKLFEAFLNM